MNATRDGVYVDSAFTKTAVGTMHRDTTFTASATGNVYAQPLYVENGPGGQEAFIVATESNHVTAISGGGATLWDKSFGMPATPANGLPCDAKINPLGITGTPTIDLASRTIYFDAMTSDGTTLKHMIHAISLDDGSEKTGWPVDVGAAVSGFTSAPQNQRGGLLLLNGSVYVPYGGHYGDCPSYQGWIIGVSVTNPTSVKSWSTPASASARGTIWAPGGLSSDGTSVFAATGNTSSATPGLFFSSPSSWAGGEAVIRFGADLAFSLQNPPAADYFVPTNWASLDSNDLDLGGTNPVLFDLGTQHLIVVLGKDGLLYLLNRDNLGGISSPLSSIQVSNGAIMGAPAAYRTSQGTYVAFRAESGSSVICSGGQGNGNLGVAKITAGSPPTASVVWCSTQPTQPGLGSPMVTTTDGTSDVIVWDADSHLYGYDGDTGTLLYDGSKVSADAMSNAMQYFNAPIAAKGRIVTVDQAGQVYIFKP
jgi:hypothetical protein